MSITRTARTAGVAAGIAAAAVALTACHPHNQQDSELGKVDTATSFAAASTALSSSSSSASSLFDSDTTDESETDTDTDVQSEPAENTPLYQSCMDEPSREPDIIALSCQTVTNNVEHIQWDYWGEDEAAGTGVRITNGVEREVSIVLTDVEDATFGPTFSTVLIDGTPIEIL